MTITGSPNWGIIGHAWAVDFLRRSIAGGHAAHAYLLSGPAGVGKAPLYATIVLVANTSGDLLPTIVSRCRPLKLRPVPRTELAAALRERCNLEPGDAGLLAAWSGGRAGWALRMVAAPEDLEAR